jgi:hypothetical protein
MVKRAALPGILLLALAGCGTDEPRPEDLRKLVRSSSPNNYLVCAPGLCEAKADEPGFAVDVPPETLLGAVHSAAGKQPDTQQVGVEAVIGQLVFLQRTRWLGFPDVIRIQAIKDKDGRAALALYSHSIYGYYDFGANKARAQAWLKAIQAELAKG